MIELKEEKHSWISEETKIEGTIHFSGVNRIFGEIKGKIIGEPGSHLIFMEKSRVIGEVNGDEVTLNGRLEGKVTAEKKCLISSQARVKGEILAKSFQVDFGAIIDGEIKVIR